MPRNRPTSVLVIAILHLIGGSIVVLFLGCGLAFQLAGGQKLVQNLGGPAATQQQDRMERFLDERMPARKAIEFGQSGMGVLLGVMLLAAGIGLIRMQPWARVLSIVFGGLAILLLIGSTLHSLFVTSPAMQAFFEQEGKGDPGMAMASSMMGPASIVGACFNLLLLVYPIAVLVIMFLPGVAAAFRGEGSEPGPGVGDRLPREDYDEPFRGGDPDDRYRREER